MGSFGLAQQDPKEPSILDYPKIQSAQMAGLNRAVGLMRLKRFEEAGNFAPSYGREISAIANRSLQFGLPSGDSRTG